MISSMEIKKLLSKLKVLEKSMLGSEILSSYDYNDINLKLY